MGVAGAAAIGAVGTLGTTLMKGSGGSSSSSQSTAPWGPQQGYMLNGLGQAQTVYNQRQQQGPYTGEFYAPQNTMQQGASDQAAGWVNGAGGSLPGQTASTAGALQGAAPGFVNNAANIASRGIAGPNAGLYGTLYGYGTGAQQTPGASSELSTALNGAAVSGAQGLQGFQNTLANAGQMGVSDPTQRIAGDAAAYAANPGVQNSINSTNAQIDQTLNEQTLPGLNRQAAIGGVLNSSRAGMGEGMANEGAAIAKGNADASILNNAYNTGMSTASGLYSSGLNSAVTSGMFGYSDLSNNANANANREQGLNEFNTTTQLGAANSGLGTGLNYALGDAQTQLSANGQLGSAAGLGINGATAAGTQANNNFALGAAAGGLTQQGNQTADNNALAQWQMANQYNQGILNDYWGIVGKPLGSAQSGNTQQTLPPNYAGAALGGASAGAGLYQYFNNPGNGYDPSMMGYSGDVNSPGASTLQSLGLFNPLS